MNSEVRIESRPVHKQAPKRARIWSVFFQSVSLVTRILETFIRWTEESDLKSRIQATVKWPSAYGEDALLQNPLWHSRETDYEIGGPAFRNRWG